MEKKINSTSRDWASFDFHNHAQNVMAGRENMLSIKDFMEYIKWSKTHNPEFYGKYLIVEASVKKMFQFI